MGATLAQVRATLRAGLQAVRLNGKGVPVVDWHGPLNVAPELLRETFARSLTYAVAWERNTAEVDISLLSSAVESAKTISFLIHCVAQDGRGTTPAVKGDSSLAGMDALIEAAENALTFLDVPVPPATLSFAVTGTPNAVVTFGTSVLRTADTLISYQPTTAGLTLDGSGNGTLNATCVTPGELGNAPPGLVLTWNATPSGLAATAATTGTITQGVSGLLRAGSVEHQGSQPLAQRPELGLYVSSLRFSVVVDAPNAPLLDGALATEPLLIVGNVNLQSSPDAATNPVDQFTSP